MNYKGFKEVLIKNNIEIEDVSNLLKITKEQFVEKIINDTLTIKELKLIIHRWGIDDGDIHCIIDILH